MAGTAALRRWIGNMLLSEPMMTLLNDSQMAQQGPALFTHVDGLNLSMDE